jgi:tetratricopeptide (TPR) repeat protein
MDPVERRAKVERSNQRFRSPILVDLLIDEGRSHLASSPHTALGLAECAHSVALRIPHDLYGSIWAMTALARAMGYRGNALRVLGDLRAASGWLEGSVMLHEREGDQDPMATAELVTLLATLYLDQGRYAESDEELGKALKLYRKIDDDPHAAHIQVMQGAVLAEMGQLPEAIAVTREALSLIDPSEDAHCYLSAAHSLAVHLRDARLFVAAREQVATHSYLYQQFADDRLIQLRRTWLEATIAHGLGELEEAELGLIAVRQGFDSEGLGYDAALAGLDLALVYVDKGEPRAVRSLAKEMVPVFLSQDIHREATAALMLFQEAARQEAVTADMLRELSRYLRQVRTQPTEKPS